MIEEDYAKRMAKLSKTVLGRDEIGYVPFMPRFFVNHAKTLRFNVDSLRYVTLPENHLFVAILPALLSRSESPMLTLFVETYGSPLIQ